MNLSRISRLVQLLGLLQAGKGRNAAELAATCAVTRRTIFRDLDVLRQAGVPLIFDDEAGVYRIPGTYFLPPTNFTTEEALAVIVLCYELGNNRRLPFYEAAHSARAEARRQPAGSVARARSRSCRGGANPSATQQPPGRQGGRLSAVGGLRGSAPRGAHDL